MQLPAAIPRWRTTLLMCIVLAMHAYFLWAALAHKTYLTDDSIQYLTIAENLAAQGAYSQSFAAPFTPDVQRTPGYPIFLFLLGRFPALVLLVQHLLVLGAAWFIYKAAERLYRQRIATAGAKIYLLQPYPIIMASYVLSETLFIFLLVFAFWAYVRFWKAEGWRWLILALAVLVVATLVRPVALPLLALATLLALVHVYRLGKQRLWRGALAALVPVLLLAPWYVRNHAVSGKWTISTMGNMGMVHGRLGGLETWRSGREMNENEFYMAGDSIAALEMGLLNLRHYPAGKQTHETEQLADGVGRLTIGFFWAHPWDALRFEVRCCWEMLKGVGYGWAKALTHSKTTAGLAAGLQLLCNVMMFLGTFLAVVRWREWSGEQKFTFWAIVVVFMVSAAGWADGRYRMVIDPLLLMMALFILRRQEVASEAMTTIGAADG